MQPTRTAPETIPARTTDLIEHAERLGLTVVWALDLPERGRYVPGVEVIALRHGMTERRTVSTLAHELGHARHGDWCSSPAAERRAWAHAARLLIDAGDYATAERLCSSRGGIAAELGVTVEVIDAYRVGLAMAA